MSSAISRYGRPRRPHGHRAGGTANRGDGDVGSSFRRKDGVSVGRRPRLSHVGLVHTTGRLRTLTDTHGQVKARQRHLSGNRRRSADCPDKPCQGWGRGSNPVARSRREVQARDPQPRDWFACAARSGPPRGSSWCCVNPGGPAARSSRCRITQSEPRGREFPSPRRCRRGPGSLRRRRRPRNCRRCSRRAAP